MRFLKSINIGDELLTQIKNINIIKIEKDVITVTQEPQMFNTGMSAEIVVNNPFDSIEDAKNDIFSQADKLDCEFHMIGSEFDGVFYFISPSILLGAQIIKENNLNKVSIHLNVESKDIVLSYPYSEKIIDRDVDLLKERSLSAYVAIQLLGVFA